jgi:putative transposase
MSAKRDMIEPDHSRLSVRRQCTLIGVNRASWYAPAPLTAEPAGNRELMRRIDEIYTARPFYGSRKIVAVLERDGLSVNRKRVQRLMRLMGIASIAPKPYTSRAHPKHPRYPYLLGGVTVTRPNQVWSTDVTYIRLEHGFAYLVAVIDWYSRKVLSWRLSNTLDTAFCLDALNEALERYDAPEMFNTDQGCQFTSEAFTGVLKAHDIRISMDGKGRALDNIFVERLWRSVKYEEVYPHHYQTMNEARDGLDAYFRFYNHERPHQALANQTPAEVHGDVPPLQMAA